MSVGIGVVTYNRPGYLTMCLQNLLNNSGDEQIYVQDDGSPVHNRHPLPSRVKSEISPTNEGVGKAKNRLFRRMLADKHDWLILCEDDIIVTSPDSISRYVQACEADGLHHLNFHGHGPLNKPVEPEQYGARTSIWPHCVGAWSIYSRECLLKVGLMDETFHNCWEHVEHTLRLGYYGYTTIGKPGAGRYADARGSDQWLAEIPGSIEHSSIPVGPSRYAHQYAGQQHWKKAHPETYHLVFPD